jgi:hypothetical protein
MHGYWPVAVRPLHLIRNLVRFRTETQPLPDAIDSERLYRHGDADTARDREAENWCGQ